MSILVKHVEYGSGRKGGKEKNKRRKSKKKEVKKKKQKVKRLNRHNILIIYKYMDQIE